MVGVLQLPRPTVSGATRRQIWWGRFCALVGHVLNRISILGFVRPVEIHDSVTGQHIRISVGRYFTVISVDGRDYYFRRLTGRLDGTGSCCSTRLSCCRPDQVRG